uniref:Putative secreted peptide n=1 Tax=Anopheles braziliensis TaxID=58242 RepID=A0A2M3ZRJ5_9DIPT
MAILLVVVVRVRMVMVMMMVVVSMMVIAIAQPIRPGTGTIGGGGRTVRSASHRRVEVILDTARVRLDGFRVDRG